MSSFQEQKVEELIRHISADFLARESNRTSLITVTGIRLSDKQTKATVLISVLPEEREMEAIEFLKRKRTDLREYIKEHSRMRILPRVDFEIDIGEKNRQKIDTLLSK